MVRRAVPLVLAMVCAFTLTACSTKGESQSPARRTATIIEVSPPAEIQRLGRFLDRYQPQVQILSPVADAVLNTDTVTVQLAIADLPIFRHPEFGLGPHIDVILDEREHREVFDLGQPLVFADLAPGTHTLRAFASRPWQESFKNREAYAQVTFHVYEKTAEHAPLPNVPLLSYNGPEGDYGGEPILLDFYLRHLPLNVSPLDEDAPTWQVRVTVDGESFVLDRWQSPYLRGWQPGSHVVKLELLDENGQLLPGPFNSTARLVTYTPNGRDTLSRLLRGETLPGIEAIVNPDYAPLPTAKPTVETETKPEAAPVPEAVTAPPSPEPPAKPVKKKRERPLKKAKAAKEPEAPIAPVETPPVPEPPVAVPTEPAPVATPEPLPAPMTAEPEPAAPIELVVPPTLEGTPVPIAEPTPETTKAAQVQKLHELLQKRLQEKG